MNEAQTGLDTGRTRRKHTRVISVAVGVGALAIVALAFVGVAANSTSGCSSCHRAQSKALAATNHENVACEACHAAPPERFSAAIGVVFRMVPASIGGVRLNGPSRPMGDGACTGCHDATMSSGVVSAKGLRIKHSTCAIDSHCFSCHSSSAHGRATRVARTPTMTQCTTCHVKQRVSTQCVTCHTDEVSADRIKDPVWTQVHGRQWRTMHGLGDQATCLACHSQDDCGECHGPGVPHPVDFGSTHGKYAQEAGRDTCLSCHESESFCNGCHTIEMPHPEGFLQRHSSIAKFNEDPACTVCHPLEDCRSCHTYHIHPGGSKPPVGRNGEG